MHLIRSILALTFTLTLSVSASDVLLRTAADPDASVIGRIPSTHPAFEKGTQVSDPNKANDGWYQTTVNIRHEGYVSTDELGKNFAVNPGTVIRVAPKADANELTTCREQDRINVSGLSNDRAWATVEFTKAATAYYLISELPSTVAIDSPRPQKTHISRLDPNKPVVNMETHRKGRETVVSIPEGSITGYTPIGPTDLVANTEDSASQTPQTTAQTSDAVIRNLVGTLQRERSSEPVIYPLRLYKGNKRIAYVDMSTIFISDLRPFLGKQVLIQGEVRPLSAESAESVIQARSLQLSE
ncbi:MAG: hypothetical protein ACPGJU_06790 [Coraliomargarita sp.]